MDFLTTSLWAILISTMRKVLVLSSEKMGVIGRNWAGTRADTPTPPLDSSLKQILEFLIIKLEEK